MKQDRYEEGRFTEHAHGLGTVTEEMVRRRAKEIALINGRGENQVLSSDLQQARHELTGRDVLASETNPAELVPEDKRWAPEEESEGRQTPSVPVPDEQTFAEKLVAEGVEEAEHDQMVEATRESLRRES